LKNSIPSQNPVQKQLDMVLYPRHITTKSSENQIIHRAQLLDESVAQDDLILEKHSPKPQQFAAVQEMRTALQQMYTTKHIQQEEIEDEEAVREAERERDRRRYGTVMEISTP
jgi:hypothetical protein